MMQQRRINVERGRIALREDLASLITHYARLTAKLDHSCEITSGLEGRLNVSDVGRSRQTIEYGKTVGQDSGAEGAEQDVFERGFIRTLFAAQETGEDVETESHGLKAEEHHDEVHSGRHEHHSDAGEEQERVVFALLFLFDLQVFHGQKNHESGGGQKKNREEKKERINHDRVMETGDFVPYGDRSAEPPESEGAEEGPG